MPDDDALPCVTRYIAKFPERIKRRNARGKQGVEWGGGGGVWIPSLVIMNSSNYPESNIEHAARYILYKLVQSKSF